MINMFRLVDLILLDVHIVNVPEYSSRTVVVAHLGNIYDFTCSMVDILSLRFGIW